jgi:hypothetical protein
MSADARAAAIACAAVAVLACPLRQGLAQTSGPGGPDAWLSSDSASRTASIRLEVTQPAGSQSALLNGHRAGAVQIVVPLNWTVSWEWQSADSSATHSLVVMTEREKLPTEGGRPAFDNAMTRSLAAGLAVGQKDQTTFTADQAGWYWMLCGVPGHALAGEYIGLRVDPEAKSATVKLKT